jgi:hypothetical protein
MKKNWFKYITAFLTVLLIRLMPFRAPNIEPIMAVIMPIGKKCGNLMAFMFGSISIVIYDLLTSGIGVWTLVTAFAYGLLGVGSFYFFQNRTGWRNYAVYAVIATIFYDAITGLTIGPLFFHQLFMVSLVGQIPFTFLHLLGNVSFAIVLSPVIERWLVKSESKIMVNNVVLVS